MTRLTEIARVTAYTALVVLCVVGLIGAASLVIDVMVTGMSMPQCQEDQVLLGTGDFNEGRWSSYECGPAADDFAP